MEALQLLMRETSAKPLNLFVQKPAKRQRWDRGFWISCIFPKSSESRLQLIDSAIP